MKRCQILAALALILLGTGCRSTDIDIRRTWSGTMDTLASGEIVVHNTDVPLWTPDQSWRIEEELRIGSNAEDGPEIFGRIASFDVDSQGRIYVLDGQAQEVRVFDAGGAFVRTVGSKGNGPGEFANAVAVDISPTGEVWVMEMIAGRVSVFDEAGRFLRSERTNTPGATIIPYPGGFDPLGRYNALVLNISEEVSFAMARFDQFHTPIDTIPLPQQPGGSEFFELREEGGGSTVRADIPFQGSLDWRYCPSGNLWTLKTDQYELAETDGRGRTLRRVTKEHESIPVTASDLQQVEDDLEFFTRMGGEIDWSRIPQTKPVAVSFFCDTEDNVWVKQAARNIEDEDLIFDVFDPEGRFLGALELPFPLFSSPEPILRNGQLYGATLDEAGVPFVVKGRVVTNNDQVRL